MDALWFVVTVTASAASLVIAFLALNSFKSISKLPPGPLHLPVISSLLLIHKSRLQLKQVFKTLGSRFGPLFTLYVGSHPFIIVCHRCLFHEALVHNGAIFADRPKALPTAKALTNNRLNITLAAYGPTWRLLRRNLVSHILHPSLAKDFSHARKWALDILLGRLRASIDLDVHAMEVKGHFRFTVFSLLFYMCFGDKLDQCRIKEIEDVLHKLLVSLNRFQLLDLWPSLTWLLLRHRWNELFDLKKKREEVLVPHIRSRRQLLEQVHVAAHSNSTPVTSYLDTLVTLELPEKDGTKRKLCDEELVILCSEFLNSGTDTTSTALEWIMANLVKYPNTQVKLFEEIKRVIGAEAREVEEDALSKIPYLKAVILEGLRRHPPTHLAVPHAVTQDVELGGYRVPRNAILIFPLSEMGWDPDLWEDPMLFKPERFLSVEEKVDITGSHEIKMVPFGAGRRICPAFGLATLHLEYIVANLVWNFEWATGGGFIRKARVHCRNEASSQTSHIS